MPVQPRYPAPEFSLSQSWLNVARPLQLSDLAGRVVLLHFWTYSSIECLSVLDSLRALQRGFRNRLVLIGIHCGKYPAQKDDRNLASAAWQYRIDYPIVNDHNFEVWRRYSVRDWPTFVLIDAQGQIVSFFSGRDSLPFLAHHVTRLIQEPQTVHSAPKLNGLLLPKRRRSGRLNFPSRLLVDEASGRLYIADTGHHRILVCDLEGRWLDTIGGHRAARSDGTFDQARFNHPHGLALHSEHLYVADTGNQLIRRCNLDKRIVSTVAGTGDQYLHPKPVAPVKPLRTALSSPWDLLRIEKTLFITMPGIHQLWVFDLLTMEIGTYAGTGFAGLMDGPGEQAAFGMPTGITWDGSYLYVADSESNAVRRVSIEAHPTVTTLLGAERVDLGHSSESIEGQRLQHPEGIAVRADTVYISDSYNNRIKALHYDGAGQIRNISDYGSGIAGLRNGKQAFFYEPAGLACLKDRLLVADAGNHTIRVIDLSSGGVETLPIRPLS
jgi:thiol-disulfide isomerase/thioredoxin